jgi:uncharacterized membrane protein
VTVLLIALTAPVLGAALGLAARDYQESRARRDQSLVALLILALLLTCATWWRVR